MSGVAGVTRARLWATTGSYMDFDFPQLEFEDSPSYSEETDEFGLPTPIIAPGSPESLQWGARGSLVFGDDWLRRDSGDDYTMLAWLRKYVRDRSSDAVFWLYFERIASGADDSVNDLQYRKIFITGVPAWMNGNLAWKAGEGPVWWMLECLVLDEGRVLDYDQHYSYSHSHAITAVSTGPGGKFTVAGDRRHLFVKDEELTTLFDVSGSTNNNGQKAVASSALVGSNTEVTITGTVGAVADGTIAVANLQTRGARP